jgi:C-terminal peptidase prc
MQLNVFEDLWTVIDQEYLYEDFGGLDWDAVYDDYRTRIDAGMSTEDFYLAMLEMVVSLGDEHSYFMNPRQVAQDEAEFAGRLEYAGVGIYIQAVPERDRVVILLVFPGSPAEAAGLQMRDSILAADGVPIIDDEGGMRDIVRGPAGTTVTLTIQTPGQAPRDVVVERQHISTNLHVPYEVMESPGGKRVGYIYLVSFYDVTIPGQVADALDAMGPLDGLVIDNRMNTGGASTVVEGVGSYLTEGVMGYFVNREGSRPLTIPRREIHNSQDVPLVILVGEGSVSFGEAFPGMLQDIGRAYLIGQTTLGNVEVLWGYRFSVGSRAFIAHDTFRPLNNPNANWEETGIIPDLEVIANYDEYLLFNDPVVLAALAYFDE